MVASFVTEDGLPLCLDEAKVLPTFGFHLSLSSLGIASPIIPAWSHAHQTKQLEMNTERVAASHIHTQEGLALSIRVVAGHLSLGISSRDT